MVRLPIRQVLERSVDKLKRDTARVMQMDMGVNLPPMTLYSFNSALPPVENTEFLAKGSDVDIGGYSTSFLTAVPGPSRHTATPAEIAAAAVGKNGSAPTMSHIAFHGNMSLKVPQEFAGRIRTGYAGMRNRKRITLFGEDTWDLSSYSHLKIEVAYRGWEGWRNRWYCNIQTDGPVLTDLYQHRLDLPSSPASTPSTEALEPTSEPAPSFTTLHLPLSSFVLTNSGHTAERQMEMLYSRVRTIGFSLLGGGRGEEGMPIVNNQPSPAAVAEMRRRAQAGFGAGGGSEAPDPIVEQMLASDGIVLNKAQSVSPAARIRASGYHRVGEDSPSSGLGTVEDEPEQADATLLHSREEVGVKVTPTSEGYYELCVKSIQAVNFAEDEGAESADM